MTTRDGHGRAAGHEDVVRALSAVVGTANVLTDPATVTGYTTDWTGRYRSDVAVVVRPAGTDEVAQVLRLCHAADVPVTAQGGNTGLVGGGIPAPGAVLLSTRRLLGAPIVDAVGQTIEAAAGVTVAEADRAAREHGLRMGVDLASRESATLGGIVATNAGGIRMIRHGNTRRQLLGVEAVVADGRVLRRWQPLVKDNVGYDLPGLLCGSEGTLAVVTAVLMRLVGPAPPAQVVLAAVDRVDAAVEFCRRAARHGLTVEAAELMTAAGVGLVAGRTASALPAGGKAPFSILVEVSGGTTDDVVEILGAADDLVVDAVVDEAPGRRLWQIREGHTEAIARSSATPVVKLDVAVPLGTMGPVVDAITAGIAECAPGARCVQFGHFLDGNIHVNVLDVPPDLAGPVTETVFTLVARYRGSISAEHGIGRAKLPWLSLGREPVDIEVMRSIKHALDPRGILNPGVLFPAP
ncbi:FAD-binding oxidoreductase [Rhodococcus triatomae]|uniref:FAD/FMN-containing dehydrogenase n=1 Tax=Rhodococcus triatomae TaxID=300028 RepID=A0A1G8CGB1_9NOCA|nr:FAD-binding oxidoreductase [Rhodococcus triatomae]QNG18659.1 FAD-binding oxidoreductase [Rhodococcus triatomae]QNG21671.1 FAD-binding oxidoreductase [Rhodococcus triatomae]SDH44495.1 FAD/FMN-containing dehydrogenase [Rhodococcus triatomae]